MLSEDDPLMAPMEPHHQQQQMTSQQQELNHPYGIETPHDSPSASTLGRRAHLVSRPYDPLGSLPRPVPPPYYGGAGPGGQGSNRQSMHMEDDGTYLV